MTNNQLIEAADIIIDFLNENEEKLNLYKDRIDAVIAESKKRFIEGTETLKKNFETGEIENEEDFKRLYTDLKKLIAQEAKDALSVITKEAEAAVSAN